MKLYRNSNHYGKTQFYKKDITVGSGWQNNYDIGSTFALARTFYRVTTATAGFTFSGFTDGVDGREIIIFNNSGYQMSLTHEDTNSTAANRIWTFINMSYSPAAAVIVYKGIARLIYCSGVQRWLLEHYIGT